VSSRKRAASIAALIVTGCVAPRPAPTPPPHAVLPAPVVPAPETQMSAADLVIEGALEQGGWLRGTAPAGTARLTLGGVPITVSKDRQFFAGLDRDAAALIRLTATSASGQAVSRELRVMPRQWQIERVNVPLRGTIPSETFMAVRQPELDAIAAARAVRSDTGGWTQGFVWPATGRISGRCGSQRIYQGVPGAYHSGLDIATGTSGTPYVAPADGVVVLAASKPFTLEGNLLVIDHGMGLNSAFLHSSRLMVKVGDRVRQGQTIGMIGATGRASGPHLHWSLKWQDARLDPLLFLPPLP
jgi:murein DD-endopeptidase MepM/ murein hydrolase activator NlpD